MPENCCGCNGLSILNSEAVACPTVVSRTVCGQAAVIILPEVEVGDTEAFCIGAPFIGTCPGTVVKSCTFMVSQNVCAAIPLKFSALASAASKGMICSIPQTGNCPTISGCTLSIGYFSVNPKLVDALIIKAGGSIILGIGSDGASFTVTASNASAVLDFKTPSPPAPTTVPFAAQYQLLYAQLLAANLNVINGATCDNATIAINNANSFIATSPSGVGKPGAPLVQKPLENFNKGNLEGCPVHC